MNRSKPAILDFVVFATAVTAIGGFLFGYDTAVINGAISYLKAHLKLDAAQEGTAAASAILGCIPGAMCAGFLSDRFGRRKMLFLCAVLYAFSGILSALPRSFAQFLAARFVTGLGIGASSMICPVYIAEIAPERSRGRLGSLFQLGIVTGIFLTLFVNKVVQGAGDEAWNTAYGWRWMLGLEAVPAVIFLGFLFMVPESPRWLAQRGRETLARSILEKVGGPQHAARELASILAAAKREESKLSELFTGAMRRPLLIAILLMAFSQFCGINAIIYYSTRIFASAGSMSDAAFTSTVWVGLVNLLFTGVAMALVDKAGRKPLLLVGTAVQVVSLGLVGWLFYRHLGGMPLFLAIVAFIAAFAMAMGPVGWILCAEIFPTRVRGRAMSVASFTVWVSCYLVAQTFPALNDSPHVGPAITFWIYSAISLLAFVTVLAMVPETKGRSLEEIEAYWHTRSLPREQVGSLAGEPIKAPDHLSSGQKGRNHESKAYLVFLLVLAVSGAGLEQARGSIKAVEPRHVIDLNGNWQVEQGRLDSVPGSFAHTVAVPGLLDLARPAFSEVGKPSRKRQAFWYRRTFKVEGAVPEVALLKIHKACYGTRVIVNGQNLGDHVPCFTPGYYDVKPHLKGNGADNEVIIRVGANPECLPADVPRGWDFEKYLFLPGIHDSVELILAGTPFIENVQIVPDPLAKTVRAVVELRAGLKSGPAHIKARVHEALSGRVIGSDDATALPLAAGGSGRTELALALPDARAWSPEDPFLYEMTIRTDGDAVSVRFGMRTFRFDPPSGRALLNGKPYYMRGTNVCIYRFFEDAQRGELPWRALWVRRLHQQFKSMHWNSIRYCIGFPPDFWYDIADEVGFLIQDEFPIWLLNPQVGADRAPERPRAETIIPQYIEWMRERWNHPCVVIWDGQNESVTDETGKAIRAVRSLDLSNRPWENGWSEPQSPTDCVESHPYLFSRGWQGRSPFRLSEMPQVSVVPHLNGRQKKLTVPIIINEYCWLWLNRDGTPTCLTDKVYESILGPNSTTASRREVHARYVAALTEFWRAGRRCAGVLHFCGLGYSRPGDKPRPQGGATSDHWIDLERLEFEPTFKRYVRDAFSPVGLMLDFWAETVPERSEHRLKIYVINDLEADWKGHVRLRLMKGEECFRAQSASCHVPGFGREIVTLPIVMSAAPGRYTLVAELLGPAGQPVRSLRDVNVVAAQQKEKP